jgi:anaerobic magnesium-protoporphyrin IX monomethyl ester cyclase
VSSRAHISCDFHVLDIALRKGGRIISEDDFREVIALKSATLHGISSKIVGANRAMRIAEIIKEMHPGSRVVMGGVHPTFSAAELLAKCRAVDAVMRGEADHAIVPLWRWAAGDGELREIPGVTFRDEAGVIVSSEKDLAQIDLDEHPYPAHELMARETDPLVPRILTARGCTLRCVFCVSAALFGYKLNSRLAARVADQIEATRDRFGVEFVCMGDLTFMAHKPTGIAICEELIRRDLGIWWSTQTTIGRIDTQSARLMARSGCVQIGFGVESGSSLIIGQANKNVHIERAGPAGPASRRSKQTSGPADGSAWSAIMPCPSCQRRPSSKAADFWHPHRVLEWPIRSIRRPERSLASALAESSP